MTNFYKQNKLTPIINVSGFMTKIGASITNKKSIEAANKIFQNFVNIDELQAIASKRISKCFKTESAVITASAAGGLTESVASMMTGNNLDKVYQLPDTKNIKDNHIKTCGSITSALEKALPNKPNIEIEVQSLLQLKEALKFKIKRIMLDNFTLNNTKKAIKIIRCFPKIEIEVSGGMNLPKLRKFSSLDIDFISIGSLTHSSKSIDISMNVKK